MKKVNITVFGTKVASDSGCSGSCCGPSKPMKDEAEDLKHTLIGKYGEAIDYAYVDIDSEEMKGYSDVASILDKVRLPLTCLNGKPNFHGGFSQDISDEIGRLLS